MPEYNAPKAILFDMDDTIIAQTKGAERLWKELSERYAPMLPGINAETLLKVITETRQSYWNDPEKNQIGRLDLRKARRHILDIVFQKLAVENKELSDDLADTFTREREERSFLFDGAMETLEKLRSQGLILAMVTNGASDMQRGKIRKFNLEPLFEVISIEGEFGRGKPDTDIFNHTLARINVAAEHAWMVGDDLGRDIEGANRTGIHSIWVDWRKEGLPDNPVSTPDRIIHSITELVE